MSKQKKARRINGPVRSSSSSSDKTVYWERDINRHPDRTGKRKGNTRLKYHWDKIDPEIKNVLRDRKSKRLETTIRKLYYVLNKLKGEDKIIPGVKKAYKALGNRVTELRYAGMLPMDCVVDDRHPVADVNDVYNSPYDFIMSYIRKLRTISKWYHEDDLYFPRWENQRNYVEIWVEKETMRSDLVSIRNGYDLQVRIQPFGGLAGTTTLNDCIKRLKEQIDLGKNIRILYCGDLDSTGEIIDPDIERRLNSVKPWSLSRYAKKHKVEFTLERIAITEEQIEEYDLPWDPEQMSDEVQEKILNDPRTAGMELKHGKVLAASLDSLPALHLEEFEKLVADSVNEYFDDTVYEEGLEEHKERYPEEDIHDDVRYYVKEFAKELGFTIF